MTLYAQLGDCRVAYLDDGTGPALVFLHGLGTNKAIWEAQASAFRGSWRVIRPDLRGFGQSQKFYDPSAFTLGAFADDVIGLLDRLSAWPAVLVGSSLGGYIALEIALREQARLGKLVLAHTACSRVVEGDVLRERLAALEAGGMDHYARVAVRHALGPDATEAQRESFIEMLSANDRAAFVNVFPLRFDHCGRLGSLSLPTLVIGSEEDKVVPYRRSIQLHDGIGGARLAAIPGCGHLSYFERPKLFDATLRDFL